MKREPKPVNLSNMRDVDIKSCKMVVLSGEDQVAAAVRVVPPGGKSIDGNMFNILIQGEYLSQSIVEFTRMDGVVVKCAGPCLDAKHWSLRTRDFLMIAFNHHNGMSKDEQELFIAGLDPQPQPASSPAPSSEV